MFMQTVVRARSGLLTYDNMKMTTLKAHRLQNGHVTMLAKNHISSKYLIVTFTKG